MTSRLSVFVDDVDQDPVLAGTAYFTYRRRTVAAGGALTLIESRTVEEPA